MRQLIAPNLSTTGKVGLCLAYARQVFGVGAVYPTAWQGWLNVKYRHTDAIPGDVAVPLWFSGAGGAGHVAIHVPGKGIYSSPYKSGQAYAVLSSIAEIERIYKVKYVGWSEDINNVRVVTQEEIMNNGDVVNIYRTLLGRDPDPGGLATWVGKPWHDVFYAITASQEYASRQQSAAKTISDLQTALANEQAKPPKEVVKEVEKIVTEYVDRPVEVIKEVEKVDTRNPVQKLIDAIKEIFKKG